MQQSISTDKLMIIHDLVKSLDQHRIKSIAIDWKILEGEYADDISFVPCLLAELYKDDRPEGEEIKYKEAPIPDDVLGTIEESD